MKSWAPRPFRGRWSTTTRTSTSERATTPSRSSSRSRTGGPRSSRPATTCTSFRSTAQPGTRVDVEDTKTGELRKGLVNFASYNYLGLSYRPEVKQAIKDAADIYGGGSSGSPILSGTTALHRQLAEEIAAFKGQEAAMIFPTGYSANVGTIAGLMRSGDLIVADQYSHASIVDGMILSKAKSRFFRHNRADDLDRKLSGFDGKKLVIVEGVYSMDGDTPPLAEIVEVCKKHGHAS
jgi:7-keto-8-aminopelargonate synthetase-like enzyme